MTSDTGAAQLQLRQFLDDYALLEPGADLSAERLSGGISSEIWLVQSASATVVVKRALPQLQVQDEWRVPVERGWYESEWLAIVSSALPGYCPKPLAYSKTLGYLAMEFLDPATHPVWKSQLLNGIVEPDVATAVALRLADIHNVAAATPQLADRFDTEPLFRALRTEPYLATVAARHPDLRSQIENVARQTLETRLTLVHGDISPKNILVGRNGPVFVDAECAWWGDPAFDLSFCLNHLLLKCLARPDMVDRLVESFHRLARTYLARIRWEPQHEMEARAARLLPALFLARVDGRSPVEYLTETGRRAVREHAIPNIARPPESLAEFAESWKASLR